MFLIPFLLSAVGTSTPPDWQLLVHLGLEQAVVNKQLPEVERIIKANKIEVLPGCKKRAEGVVSLPRNALPKQIADWKLDRIDKRGVERRAARATYDYLRICAFMENGQPRMFFIVDTAVPPNSGFIVIDHAILSLLFEWRDGKWVIAKAEQLYG